MASVRPLLVLALVLVAVVATESASSPAPTPSAAAPDTKERNPLLAPKPNAPLPDSGAESPDSDDMGDDDVAPAGSPHAATANIGAEGSAASPVSSEKGSASAIGVTFSMAAITAVAASYIVF